MASIIQGYNYDIFISYRQKDNKGDMWVSEFVEALKTELEATFKEDISVYFDINPHDGLLETHDVDESLKEKLKCLVFIPIISRTYCDPKSFAWEHEFKVFFEQAKEIDQDYALAYAGISLVWLGRQQFGFASPEEAGGKAFEAAMKALELDDTSAEVYITLSGMYVWGMWDWEKGEAAYKRGIELNPNHSEAHAHYAHLLCIMGRPEDAMEHGRQSLELDPINPLSKMFYGWLLTYTYRRYDEAIIVFSEVLKQDPSNVAALWGLTYAFHLTGRLNDALKSWMKAAEILHNKEITQAFNDGFSGEGYTGAMLSGAEFLAELSKTTYINPVEISFGYIMAGDIEPAMEWFERAYEEHNPNVPYLVNPILDPLRDESRFQEIASKMNLPYKFS